MPSGTRRFLVAGAVCLSVLGCASKGPVTANSDHAATAAAVAAVAPATGAPAAAAATSSPNAQPVSTTKQATVKVVAHPPGSRRVVRDGVVYYCSSEPVVGTKISGPEKCLTEEQAAEQEREAKEQLRQMTRPMGPGGGFSPGPQPH
jgi:hypothetical protein